MEERVNDLTQQMGEQCMAFRVRRLSRAVTKIYDDALRFLGIRVNTLNILMYIGLSGEVKPSKLGAALEMDKSTVSRTVKLLIEKEFVKVTFFNEERGQSLSLSEKGEDLVRRAKPAWEFAQKKAEDLLGKYALFKLDSLSQRLD